YRRGGCGGGQTRSATWTSKKTITPNSQDPTSTGLGSWKLEVGSLNTSSAETAPGDLAEVPYFLPADARRGEHNALGQAIAPLHLHFGATDIEHLDFDFVVRPAITAIQHTDAIGHYQSALERSAASGKNGEEVSGRHLDDEARRDERNLPGRPPHILRCGQVESGRFFGRVCWEGNCGVQPFDLQAHRRSIRDCRLCSRGCARVGAVAVVEADAQSGHSRRQTAERPDLLHS